MTGYSRVSGLLKNKKFAIELHSVNKRGLDIHTYLPKELLFIDTEIKKWIAASCHRGQVTVKIFSDPLSEVGVELLQKVDQQLKAVAKQLGYIEEKPYPFPFLLEEAQKYAGLEPDAGLLEILEPFVKKAIAEWNLSREKEAVFLVKDISERWNTICAIRENIAGHKDKGAERYGQRLTRALEEFSETLSDEDKRRLLKEVVIYTEKADISEELVRLQAHLQQFDALLRSAKPDVGKTLDFFVQEMQREANTMASKANDIELIHNVVEMKGELEKIREQVQNIE